jgi:hypothetical protein
MSEVQLRRRAQLRGEFHGAPILFYLAGEAAPAGMVHR